MGETGGSAAHKMGECWTKWRKVRQDWLRTLRFAVWRLLVTCNTGKSHVKESRSSSPCRVAISRSNFVQTDWALTSVHPWTYRYIQKNPRDCTYFSIMISKARLLSNIPKARTFAAISSSSPPPSLNTVGPYQVFDRNVKRLQRDRAAIREGGERSRTVDYVRNEVAERMLDRFLVQKPCLNSSM